MRVTIRARERLFTSLRDRARLDRKETEPMRSLRTEGDRQKVVRSVVVGMLIVALGVCSSSTKSATASGNTLAGYPEANVPLSKKVFQQRVKADPNNKDGWYMLGVIEQSDKDSESAIADYEKAIALDSKFESALYNLGVIRFQAGDYTAAISLLTRAVAANPNDANAHWTLGLALAKLHTVAGNEQSRVELNRAAKLDPSL